MAPLPKLVWFREEQPELTAQVRHWVGIKDYVLLELLGVLVTDHSLASGTGLMDIHRLQWDPEGLQLAGISADQLPELLPTTTMLPGLLASAAEAVHLPTTTPVIVGAGDGPLANLGLGAVRPGVAACSIGTSGALRVMVERPNVDEQGRSFCYALTEQRWVVGGAVNNGGLVLDWCGDALAPELDKGHEDELLRQAGAVPPGSGGLIMLPYLQSERAPHWSSFPSGAYIGLTREHRRGHLIRAALEGVCQQLALVVESVRGAGNDVREIRATGGFARSALWRQMLADVLGMPIGLPGWARRHESWRRAARHGGARARRVDRSGSRHGPHRRNRRPRPRRPADLCRPTAYVRQPLRRAGPGLPRPARNETAPTTRIHPLTGPAARTQLTACWTNCSH